MRTRAFKLEISYCRAMRDGGAAIYRPWGRDGITAFLLEKPFPRIRVERRSEWNGLRGHKAWDLRLEAVPRGGSHLGFSGTYETSSSGAGSRDAITRQRSIEACVRRFITAVAATLERGGADVHAMPVPH